MPILTAAGGDRIAWDDFGDPDAPPLLLIQGFGAQLVGWRPGFCQRLAAEGFHVIRLDNRDVGQSQRHPEGGYALSAFADDTVALLDGLGIGAAHIVGQSMGGMIAQELVLRHPDRVRSLGLMYTTSSDRFLAGRELVEGRMAVAVPTTRAEFIPYYVAAEAPCASTAYPQDIAWLAEVAGIIWDRGWDADGPARQLQAILGADDRTALLAEVRVPTTILAGDADQLIDWHASEELRDAVPGSTLTVFPGMGHEVPEPLWTRIAELLAENARRAKGSPAPSWIAAAPRIAGAPISWGVSEVPGWGVQLAPDRVLAEMRELGFTATELGPDGFLPESPAAKAAELASFDLAAVGGFVPVVLHRDDDAFLATVERVLADFEAAGADVLVLAAVTGDDGYDLDRPQLDDAEWARLFANLDRLRGLAAERGVRAVLHPHAGTVVETRSDVDRVLAGSSIDFCFDTGHLMIGGTDPVAFAAEHADRIAHAHLKDVSRAGIERVRAGEISYYDAIVAGELYRPLGQGDVDLRAILTSLDAAGYRGWFVLEQDQVLAEEPAPGSGPLADARTSVEFLRAVLAELAETRTAAAR